MSVVYREPFRKITTHKELRDALRDTETYSSDLQGDADVRDYRQLPLEVDPPRHHQYRTALAPFFVKPAIEKFIPNFKINSEQLIQNFFAKPNQDVVSDLALKLVMQNLGVIFNRPQDVVEWISWGPDVWTAESKERSGNVLHKYLDRIYQEALGNDLDDIWHNISRLEIDSKQISPIEFRGIAGVLLAGGRDTIVKLLTGIMWFFGKEPSQLEALRNKTEHLNSAISEFLRYFSPLPQMNRTIVPESINTELPDDRYVGMSFLSGNFDPLVFENPFTIDLYRPRNPHLSFGFGPHTCLGIHIADIEAKVFLSTLLASEFTWKISSEKIQFHDAPHEMVPDSFEELRIDLL